MKIEFPDGHVVELSTVEYAALLLALGTAHEHATSDEIAERFLQLYNKLGGEFGFLYTRKREEE